MGLPEPLSGEFAGGRDKSCNQWFCQNTYPSNKQNLSLVRCLPKIHQEIWWDLNERGVAISNTCTTLVSSCYSFFQLLVSRFEKNWEVFVNFMEHFLLQLVLVWSSVVQVSTFQHTRLVLVSGLFPSAFPHAWHVLVWGTTLKTSYRSGYYASPATLSVWRCKNTKLSWRWW